MLFVVRHFTRVYLALALFFTGAVGSTAADLALVGGTVYVSPDATPINDGIVVVHGDRITAAGKRGATRIPKGAQTLDCTGGTVVAGFWNNHVHIIAPSLLHARDADAAVLGQQIDEMFNRWGFTTVFDVASVLGNTLALRRRIDSHELPGPRVLTVGEPLWTAQPIYIRDHLTANHVSMPVVTTPDDAAAQVRALAGRGADGIKLFTGSLQDRGRVAIMPLEMVRAAVEEAHRLHLPVFTHPQNLAGVEVAIAAGVDILAHTVPDSPAWTAEFVARLNAAHMALIPTLTLFDYEARKIGAAEKTRQQWGDRMTAELRIFEQGGGDVLFGTDVGYTDHYDTALEFTLMSRAGMNFAQILASLTTNPARRFGYAGKSGRIANGMEADLVVLQGGPEDGVTAFSKVRFTIRGGRLTYSSNKAVLK